MSLGIKLRKWKCWLGDRKDMRLTKIASREQWPCSDTAGHATQADWVVVLRPTRHKITHLSACHGKQLNLAQLNHAFISQTKCTYNKTCMQLRPACSGQLSLLCPVRQTTSSILPSVGEGAVWMTGMSACRTVGQCSLAQALHGDIMHHSNTSPSAKKR